MNIYTRVSCLRTFFAVVVVVVVLVLVACLAFPPLGPARYLLDYPVLINSSDFIFIFTTPRSRTTRLAAGQTILPSFEGREEGGKRDEVVADRDRKGRLYENARMVIDSVRNASWRREMGH